MSDLTENEVRLLTAIGKFPNNMASAENIAWRLGYRPARKGILAVSSMCRAMMRRHNPSSDNFGAESDYLCRLPPKDQWDHALWCLTPRARQLLNF